MMMYPISFNLDYSFFYFNRSNTPLDKVLTKDILSCTKMIPLWVSWTGGRLALGYGTLPTYRTIVSYEDPNSESVNYLGFSTLNNEGQWLFHNIPGKVKFSGLCQQSSNVITIHVYFWNVAI